MRPFSESRLQNRVSLLRLGTATPASSVRLRSMMNGKVPPDCLPAHGVDLASGSPRGMRLRWRRMYIVNTKGVWKERRIQTLLHQDGWRTFVLLSNWDNLAVHPETFSQQTQHLESIYRISLRARTVIPVRFTFIMWSFFADGFNCETAVQHLDMAN